MPHGTHARKVFLNPGDIYFGDGAARIQTVLGSCVSVAMRNPRTGFSAMCHCMLPRWRGPRSPLAADPEVYRYVDTCIPFMFSLFEPRGGLEEVEIKMFGGADMFTARSPGPATVGAENTAVAIDLLRSRNLTVLGTDVGGNRGRKLLFDTRTGEVLVKHLRPGQEKT